MKIDLSSQLAYNMLCAKRISLTEYVDYIDGKITLSQLIKDHIVIQPSSNMLFGITNEDKALVSGNGTIMKNLKDLKENEGVLIKSSSEYERITGSKIDILSSIILKRNGEICSIDCIEPPITLYKSKDVLDCFKPYIVRCVMSRDFIKKDRLYICVDQYAGRLVILINELKVQVYSCDFEKI